MQLTARLRNRVSNYQTIRTLSYAVRITEGGGPKLEEAKPIDAPGAGQVAIKFLASPLNPTDTVDLKMASICGDIGVAEVISTSGSSKFTQGDWVAPKSPTFGCWRSFAIATQSELLKVPKDIPPSYAAMALGPGALALRLLTDFAQLEPGDAIVQSGGETPTGKAL